MTYINHLHCKFKSLFSFLNLRARYKCSIHSRLGGQVAFTCNVMYFGTRQKKQHNIKNKKKKKGQLWAALSAIAIGALATVGVTRGRL